MTIIDIIMISIAVILIYNLVNVIVLMATDNEETVTKFACGIMLPVMIFISYPFRAWSHYTKNKEYYSHHCISRFQYICLFKRIKEETKAKSKSKR